MLIELIRKHIVWPDLKAQIVFWPLLLSGLVLDLCTKTAAFSWLEQKPEKTVVIIDRFLRLTITENPIATVGFHRYWGVLGPVIFLSGVFFVVLLGGYKDKLLYAGLAFLVAGVAGNVYDRITRGGFVRDFIEFFYGPGSPEFNIADMIIWIGFALFIVAALRESVKRLET